MIFAESLHVQASHQHRVGRVLILAFLVVFWLVPMFWASSMLAPLPMRVPNILWQEYTTGGLFTKRVSAYREVLIQVRRKYQADWHTVDLTPIAPMCVSGYRHRLDRILGDSKSKKSGEQVRARVAAWITWRVNGLQPEMPVVTSVRFAENIWQTNTPELTAPKGKWMLHSPTLPPSAQFAVLATYQIEDSNARLLDHAGHQHAEGDSTEAGRPH